MDCHILMNRQQGRRNVKVRLDRAVADSADARVTHLTSPRSDHCPILLTVKKEAWEPNRRKPWRYEVMWEREERLPDIIKEAWKNKDRKGDFSKIARSLRDVMSSLKTWSKENFGSVTKEIEVLRKQIEVIQRTNDSQNRQALHNAMGRMDELLYREEMMWLQRSRISWLKDGDRNTRFFHEKARWRSRKNKISKLRKHDGSWCTSKAEMGKMATDFFSNLYTADTSVNPDVILQHVHGLISAEANENLCKDFTPEEISDALFQIGPLKAPEPDGFSARFFQRNWDVIKEDVVTAVQSFFENGLMPPGVNETSIVIIPKKDTPEELKDFRPISLCNVIYKVVSKCLVNRLRPMLQDIISPNQSAFVPGRMITDNALIAFECIHALNTGNEHARNFCAYKLDLSKAYDRVDWAYLEGMMHELGFCERWIQWIMQCVTTVSFSVNFNGELQEKFTPSRGLRQGDPLSPFLFLLVADGLSVLLNKEIADNNIQSLSICRRAPRISHLLFADDSLLFFKGDEE